jgi:AI-2 transport protein TqsA
MTNPDQAATGSGPLPLSAADRRSGVELPRALVLLLGAAAAVIVAAGVQAVGWLVGAVFLALVIVITVHPVVERLRRWGWPTWASTVLLLLLIYGMLLVLSGVLVVSVARLATILPAYADQANALVGSTLATLNRFGVGAAQLGALAASLSVGKLVSILSGLLLGVAGLVGNLVFLLSLLLFLGIEASGARDRLALLAQDRAPIATALDGFARSTRRYLGINTVFGLLTGFVDMVVLSWLGVPLAILWGLLVFITNYIPYIGFWIGLVPPALLALLVGGWELAAVVVVVFLVVNFVLTSVVQPKFVGDTVGLSVTVILIALVFWAWLLGPVGAVLATPLTLFVKVVLVDVDPRARWADAFICSTRRVRPTPTGAAAPDADGAPQ